MIAVEKDTRLPVTIVTGFLGSGKTAFLRRSLDGGRLSDALIVVNEAAPYGVDDKLLRDNASGVALLANGCICCRIDKGMKEELHRILALNGRSLHFKSVVIELSGLADPVAVIATIASDPYLNGQMRIALVVALADCLHAADSDREQPEHRRQLEAADIVLLSKTDLATIEKRRATERLAADAAPLAPCLDGRELRLDNLQAHAAGLRADRLSAARFRPPNRIRLAGSGIEAAGRRTRFHCQAADAVSFCIRIEGRLDWISLSLWLSLLVHVHGEQVLRIKGFLAVDGASTPILINCVRHVVYFPEHVDDRSGEAPASWLVFIVRQIEPELLMRSFRACVDTSRNGGELSLSMLRQDLS